ncbi:unnamed protein product [Cunninghamella blakesleeana]
MLFSYKNKKKENSKGSEMNQVPPETPTVQEDGNDIIQTDSTPEFIPSVIKDLELIAQKELAPIDEEVVAFEHQHWELEEWSSLPDRVQGPIFEAGGHDGMFYYSLKETILCNESDWGFTRFVDLRQLVGDKGCLENDAIRITTIIKIIKDPTGVLWHNFHNYDSKKMTGYVGLKNQGATCYMNSLFQSLYCTNYFRKAVFQIPTEKDEPTNSVALALQRMFYNLQTLNTPVGTTELTKSFGWNSYEAFRQHDVQEFNRVLQDNLEEKMKGTPADGAIKKLFLGRMKSYIKCINVDYESSRSEDYYDIQLNVKGCENLEQSFKDYIAEETLEGDNKYMAEGHGLQDAKKGVIFESFPPVLHLQLKRFEYDIMRDMMVKINDRHEFPLSIDLAPYLAETADKSVSHEYMLHGVLVHSGDLSGGHYFAFVKPTTDDKWLKFDDDRVVPSTLKEVLEENFGGEERNVNNQNKPNDWAYKRVTNAYMLVYIRKSMLNEIVGEVTLSDIPHHLIQRIEDERAEKERKRREKEEEHLYMKTLVVTDDAFIHNHDLDFINFDDENGSGRKVVTVLKTQTYNQLKHSLANDLGLPTTHFRPWILVNRQNKTVRPDAPVPEEDFDNALDDVRSRHVATHSALRIYIETATNFDADGNPEFPPYSTNTPNPNILVFIKLFDKLKQDVHGIGKLYVPKNAKVGSIVERLNKLASFEPDTPITLYEEIKPEMVEIMDLEKTFAQSEIQDGDIICIEKELSDEKVDALQKKQFFVTVSDYMNYLYNKREVQFYDLDSNSDMMVDVTLSRGMNLHHITKALADKIDADPDRLLIYLPHSKNDRKPGKRFPLGTISDVERVAIQGNHNTNHHHHQADFKITRLNYELLDMSVLEYENTRRIGITWFTPTLSDGTFEEVSVPKQSRISDIIEQLIQRGASFQSEHGTRDIRVFEAIDNKYHREFQLSDSIQKLSDHINARLYVEEIPEEEAITPTMENDNENNDEVQVEQPAFISVFHYQRDVSRTHSIPFKFLVIKGEPFSETKKRLQNRTGLSDSDWNKVKICLVHISTEIATSIDDVLASHNIAIDDFILSEHYSQENALGLDHIDKSGRMNRNPLEQGLTIRG